MNESLTQRPLERLPFLDILKGFLIFLVTFGHCIQYIYYRFPEDGYWTNPLFKAIYMFHMPLFVLVSGYVLHLGAVESLGRRFKKRTLSLAVPTLLWAVGYALFSGAGFRTTAPEEILLVFLGKINYLWFLPCLYLSWMLSVLFKERRNFPIALQMIFLVIAVYYLPDFKPLSYLKYVFPFYCMGDYLARKKEILNFGLTHIYALSLFFLLAYTISYSTFNTHDFVYTSGSQLTEGNLSPILKRFFAAGFGCGLFSCLVYFIYKALGQSVAYWIRTAGKDSIYIYIIQIFLFTLSNKFGLDKYLINKSYLFILIVSIFFIVSTCYFARWIKRYPVLNLLLFGRKDKGHETSTVRCDSILYKRKS